MKKLYTAKDIQEMLDKGICVKSLGSDAIITPAAQDLIKDALKKAKPVASATSASSKAEKYVVIDEEYKWVLGGDPKTAKEIEAFFNSPKINALKELMCELGKRSWEKGFNDGNGGNITVRVGDNLVLCTPTMISKKAMTAADMCLITLNDGTQVAGTRKRTSEALAHLAIMRNQPRAKACFHAHPPFSTAFALSHRTPPTCMIPESEIFVGQIGVAPYALPGSTDMADKVGQMAASHDCIFMENHGVITWGKDVEQSYWKMENVESHCHTVVIAMQIGDGPKPFSTKDAADLMKIRKGLGMVDARENLSECKLCDSEEFRPTVITSATKEVKDVAPNSGAEDLVKEITKMIISQLEGK